MNVLSLFDGMAAGALAMQAAGLEVENYDAFEIDKYAVQTSTHNFPFIKHYGDVFEADFTEFKDYDYLVGGSPCTYWSIAQKNNRETEASGLGWELFSQYVRALREAQPKYFIYENNKSMSSSIRESITETFGFEPILINSALVSAQNRQRLYWVGKREEDGTYSKVEIEQPEDRGILLRDILESGEPFRNEKAYCLTANYLGAYPEHTLAKSVRSMVAEPVRIGTIESEAQNTDHDSKQYRVYSPDGKSTTICGQGGGVGAKTGLYAVPVETEDNRLNRLGGLYNQKTRWGIWDVNGVSPSLTASMGMGGGHVSMVSEQTKEEGRCQLNPTDKRQIYEVKNGLITIKDKQYPIKLVDGFYIIRKLTVRECMKLQTVPEWYEFPVSNSQAYKMLGNGWTVEVIAHLLKGTIQ